MGSVPVLLIEDRGGVRILTMNRPEKRNALNTELTEALLDALRSADKEDSVGCVLLTGAGQGFSAGADLSEFKALQDPQAAERRAELTMQLHLAFSKISKPVVAAINGAAMGGGAGLAIAGDMALMAQSAMRQVGRKAAFELVSLGEPIDAARALQLGMVNYVVPDAELMQHALHIAERLAAVPEPAMKETKRLFHEVAELPLAAALERGRDANRRMRNFQKLGQDK